MIKPVLQDEAFLADVRAASEEMGTFHLWWLGQSGFLLKWKNHHLLLDPYLSDSLTKKYAATDKPHIRMTERVVAPERLNFIDIVSSSHNHTDHLDAETLIPLLQSNQAIELVIPEANREFVSTRLQVVIELPIGLDAGRSISLKGFTFHGIPAAHETIEKDDVGRCKFLGYIIEFGGFTVYHSGDTILYDGMEDILRQWNIDLALLPINGASPERRVAGNLNGPEAATLAKSIGARLVIPCHYEMFLFNTASPDDFAAAARQRGQPFKLLRAGERWSSSELPAR